LAQEDDQEDKQSNNSKVVKLSKSTKKDVLNNEEKE